MKWNLRLATATRGIWKAGEFHQLLAARVLVISIGKLSGLWTGQQFASRCRHVAAQAVVGVGRRGGFQRSRRREA